MAAVLQSLGVGQGDRVLIYMPMIPEAAFAMLACARIGAIHSVVFGGFASASLASRIDDAEPKVVVSADAGSRAGKVIAYKPLLDEAIALAAHKPAKVLLVDRGLAPMALVAGRDVDYADAARAAPRRARALRLGRCDPSELHALHQRHDRQAEGRAARHRRLRRGAGGEHEAHLLRQGGRNLLLDQRHRLGRRPQLHRLRPADRRHGDDHVRGPADPARRRHLVAAGREVQGDGDVHRADRDPGAEEAGPEVLAQHDLSSLRALFLAGEPLDEPTASWISNAIGKPVIDNYWQTESGWPILTLANGVEPQATKFGSPGVPMYGYDVKHRRRGHRRRTSPSPTARASSSSKARRRPASCRPSGTTTRASSRPTGRPSPAAGSTTPSTGASATPTATSSSSAAPTTSSTSPATAWARARSRRASRATRTSPRSRWSASPTR